MQEIKGAAVAAMIKEHIQNELALLNGYRPRLAVVRVGEKPDDVSYERRLKRDLTRMGFDVVTNVYSEDIKMSTFRHRFRMVCNDKRTDGVLLLSQLPPQINMTEVSQIIPPEKDVDGINPYNKMRIYMGKRDAFAPCTPMAVLEILKYAQINLNGKNVVVIGYGKTVGKPLTTMLLNRNATVSVCNIATQRDDLKALCQHADVIISAVGHAHLITRDCVPEGAVVVDVGITVDENGKLCGDVDYDEIQDVAAMATPVPGGVGAVTSSILAKQLLKAFKKQKMRLPRQSRLMSI